MDFRRANWSKDKNALVRYLNSIANTKYRDFSKKLIPGDVHMLGINLPTLKKIAKEIAKGDYEKFLQIDDDGVFELKYLKGQVIASLKDVDEYEKYFMWYLPSITDWSLCDGYVAASKIIKKDRERFFNIAKKLILGGVEFEARVGLVIMLVYMVDDEYIDRVFDLIEGLKSNHYYVKMAHAWLMCELYIKYTDRTKEFLLSNPPEQDVLKMTIRKIKDSYRVTIEDKKWLILLNK